MNKHYKIIIAILTALSIGLIIGGFFVPPIGIVSGSVLTSVGEIFGFATLWVVIAAIEKGTDVTLKKGDTEITINNED